jgi:hypothetical protein
MVASSRAAGIDWVSGTAAGGIIKLSWWRNSATYVAVQSKKETDMAKATVHPDRRLISSEDVQGTEVYGTGDEAIGEIDHLLIEKVSGRVVYAVMSFGGFLGLAHSQYPIPWSAFNYDTNLGGFRTKISEEQRKRRNSATTPGATAIGRHVPTNITVPVPIGAPSLTRASLLPRPRTRWANISYSS